MHIPAFLRKVAATGRKMELNLSRIDYAQVGTTNKRCLRLLPMTDKSPQQKVAVGSHAGILLCFGRKKHDTTVFFKTLPGPKIDCLTLGGALGTPQDKIFYAAGNIVKGFSKTGKQFFAFETNLTEAISAISVYGVDMFLCGTYTFNHYHDCADTHYFLCGDKINDVLCLPVLEGSWVGRGITAVLACDDRTIKVLDGSNMAYQVEVGGVPNIIHLYQNNGGPEGQLVLYGTKDGRVGLVELPPKNGIVKWEVLSSNGTAAVTALHCYDMVKDGYLDIIAGRDDGFVEIYSSEDQQEKPILRKSHQCNESVTALECGRVNSPHYDEIVVCTYTGWVFGLTTEPMQKDLGPNETVTISAEMQIKIQQLQDDICDLQDKISSEREQYHASTQRENGFSAVPIFAVNDRFFLNKEEAAYMLSVELMVPIDYVLLQCDVPIDLLDVDKNSAVVSLTQCEPNSGNALLATYRCQANTTRLDVKVRSIEGQYGTLQAYIAPRTHPKICQLRQYPIKPLSLHQRTHTYDSTRPQNVLKLSGGFSIAEAHSWAFFCLPEIPEKPPPGDKVIFQFFSTFTNTQLECTYWKGSAIYRSDNVSTIAILRDVLSKEATKKKIRLDISCDINDDSVAHTLQLLHPKLEYQVNLAKKVHLAEALKELALQENDTTFMSDEFSEILRKSDELSKEHKEQQAHLERIYGVVTDLYIDKYKFKGASVKHKVPQLLQILDNYSLDSLLAFFQAHV